jgi:hypothetical protein
MSDPINDGGPAFPHGPLGDSITFDDGRTSHQWPACAGMTLRDWFAGQALNGSLASQNPKSFWAFAGNPDETNSDKAKKGIAVLCYEIADAMLKARGGAK